MVNYGFKTQFIYTNSLFPRFFLLEISDLLRYYPQTRNLRGSQHSCCRECWSVSVVHTHVFWSCPHVQCLWKGEGALVSENLDWNLIPHFYCTMTSLTFALPYSATWLQCIITFRAVSISLLTSRWHHCTTALLCHTQCSRVWSNFSSSYLSSGNLLKVCCQYSSYTLRITHVLIA